MGEGLLFGTIHLQGTALALKVIEGSWDEILQHAQELQERRLRVIVLPEPAAKRTGADLLQTLTEIGFI